MAHLTQDERFKIYEMNNLQYSSRMIAKKIGRDKSTVCYELRKMKGKYRPDKAHDLTLKLRSCKRSRILDTDDKLRLEVIKDLKNKISPDVISGRRKLKNEKYISTETIYQFIYNSKIAKEEKLHLLLARKRKARLHHGERTRCKRYAIPDRVSITEREMIDDIGNFEADLTFHTGNQSRNIGSFVDKKSQKLFLFLNRSKHTNEVIGNIKKKLKKIKHLAKTMTFDNGKEFTNHTELSNNSDLKTYFCRAYCPWQKPLVEKMNSMIHRVYPKREDITKLTKRTLQQIEDFLNDLPRKILGYKTPNEIWEENLVLA